MATYAEPVDVAARLGRSLEPSESVLVATRLEDAELLIKSKIPDLAQQITDGDIDVEIVKMIEANAVVRLVRNPNAYTGETDGNYSYQINWKTATGELELLDNEWALLGVGNAVYVIAPRLWTPYDMLPPDYDPIYQGG